MPHILVAGVMLFWLYRVSVRKRVPQNYVMEARHGDAIVSRVVEASGLV
jgi:hypothetical protein